MHLLQCKKCIVAEERLRNLLVKLLLLWLLLCIPHHNAGLKQQVVDGLSDIGRVHQVVIGVFVLAVAHLQRADEGDEGRDGDLENTTQDARRGEEVDLTGTETAVHPARSDGVARTLKRWIKSYLVRSS